MKKIIIFILFIVTIFLYYIYNIGNNINTSYVEIHGNSMYPTLINGGKYRIFKIDNFSELKRNDIVLFDIWGSDIKYIKRLKILPGDKFKINFENNGKILVLIINDSFKLKFNNFKNKKFYKTLLLWSKGTNSGWVKAPQCGVFGDNYKNSIDSLEYGFIGCNKITHKVVN